MSRSKFMYRISKPISEAKNNINNFLQMEGFYETETKTGEQVWKKGTGLATAMQFLKIDFENDEVIVYGWIQMGVGSVGAGEQDLSGFFGTVSKKNLLKRIKEIEKLV